MPVSPTLRRKLDQIHAANDEASAKSLRAFLDCVIADTVPNPTKLSFVIEGWQKERNERVIPAVEYIAGLNDDYDGKMLYFENWAKGTDKSSSAARIICWLLCYSKKPLKMVCIAKDREQAEVIYNCIDKTVKLNVWLKRKLEFKRGRVDSKVNGSRLDVLTSDVGGIQGLTIDLILADELTNWANELLWDSILSSAIKRSGKDTKTGKIKSHCLVYCTTNAGFIGSWQWRLKEEARTNTELWSYFCAEPGRTYPSWIDPKLVAAIRGSMSDHESKRLFDNIWVDPSESGIKYFSPEDVDACVGIPLYPSPNSKCFLSIDYGPKKDRTVMSLVWQDPTTGIVHVPEMTVWCGSIEHEVKLEDVENWLNLMLKKYPMAIPIVDPYQMLWLLQKLEKNGQQHIRFEYRGGKTNVLMSENLQSLMKSRKLMFGLFTGLIGSSTLSDELKTIIGKHKTYGLRMDHSSRNDQHDDRAVSLGMGALAAIQNSDGIVAEQKTVELKTEEDLTEKYIKYLKGQQERTSLFDLPHAKRSGLFGM